jgi:predicted  nucleic acid-binding Zn-ribbon protein
VSFVDEIFYLTARVKQLERELGFAADDIAELKARIERDKKRIKAFKQRLADQEAAHKTKVEPVKWTSSGPTSLRH